MNFVYFYGRAQLTVLIARNEFFQEVFSNLAIACRIDVKLDEQVIGQLIMILGRVLKLLVLP